MHLAVTNSSPEVVQALIDHDARLVARLVDGKTALHLAAIRGDVQIISALLRRSEANEAEEQDRVDARRAAKAGGKNDMPVEENTNKASEIKHSGAEEDDNESDIDIVDPSDESSIDATTEHSMVKIKDPLPEADDKALDGDQNSDEPDVYDVNVLAWDIAVSPLHLAIVNGHIDAVRCLVQDFGADLLLPVKLFHDHDKSARAAILTLVLALQLPIEQAEAMTRTLIHLGASCAQADLDQNTTLQYSIVEQPEMIKIMVDADQTGVSRAVNHLSVAGNTWNPNISSPLVTAINARNGMAALLLLEQGAKPEVEFGAYMKAYQTKNESPFDSKHNKEQFQRTLEQPVVCAVQCELPGIAAVLVEQHGADPNTLTRSSWAVVNDNYSRNHVKGYSLLDEVRRRIKEMETWKPKEDEAGCPPIPLQPDSTYLLGLKQGSYAWWSARKQVEDAKKNYLRDVDTYEKNEERLGSRKGVTEKQAAIDAMLAQFKTLEEKLVQRGAKTFKELYPDITTAQEHNRHGHGYTPPKPKAFQLDFGFQLPDLTEDTQKRYNQLFESAWNGDLQRTKELTLLPWKSPDGESQPPLKVAVMDQHRLSPFVIAVLRGHLELATIMMEIAQAQYVPPDAPKRERHRLAGFEDDDEENANADADVHIISELVDETFTIETVGQVSTQTKSRVLPVTMLHWWSPMDVANDGRTSPSRSSAPAPTTLMQFAVHFRDEDLLEYLISLGEKYTKLASAADAEDATNFFALPDGVYQHAIAVDHPHMLSKLIKRTGAGLPMEQLIEQSGVEAEEKSKYYQGLSVNGKKRRDWAARGKKHRRNYAYASPMNSSRPLL